LRNSIPTTGTETVRSILRDVKRFLKWMEEDPEVTVEEQETSRDPEKIGGEFRANLDSCVAELT
jgi:hypothetical protein